MEKIKILVADDDIQICESIKIILSKDKEIEVVGFATDGEEAVRKFLEIRPDLVLMDIQMPVKTGLEASCEIFEEDKSAKILLLSTFSDDEYIIKAFQIGVHGYIIKQEYKKIASAIKSVMDGQFVFADEVVNTIPGFIHRFDRKKLEYQKNNFSENYLMTNSNKSKEENNKNEESANTRIEKMLSEYNLNKNDIEIMQLVSLGLTNKEIAEELHFSNGTIRNYISNILERLDLKNRAQLASFYSDHI